MMRLDKYMCDAGAGTRSTVKKYIGWGRVRLNGAIMRDPGQKVDETCDEVLLDGSRLRFAAVEYYMLNKPAGVISASKADLRNPEEICVTDLIKEKCRRDLFPVGRLDRDTEGLLLITNDGALAHELLSPKKHVDKVYYTELSGVLTDAAAKRLMAGVDIGDEKPTLPCRIEKREGETLCFHAPESRSACEICIHEGRFHQIKRMFETEGLTVTYLKRLSMGSLVLDEKLLPGEYRPLTEEELQDLKRR